MPKTIETYLTDWGLSAPERIAKTKTSDLFKVRTANGWAVLKLLSLDGAQGEHGAAEALLWFNGLGSVGLLQHDAGAELLEYVEGGDLTALVKSGHDDEATIIITEVLCKLHFARTEEPPPNLMPLERRFQSLTTTALNQPDPILERGATVARRLLRDKGPQQVLHGDIHHQNIRQHQTRGWLSIDPKGLIGERTYDAANALCNPNSLPELVTNEDRFLRQAAILANSLEIDPRRLFAFTFAHACLSARWSLEQGQDPSQGILMARLAKAHVDFTDIGRAPQKLG